MSTKNIYNKKILMIIRIISLTILILISITTPIKFYNTIKELKEIEYSNIEKFLAFSSLFLNCFVLISSAILLKYPQKFSLIGIGALLYSLGMAIGDLEATMSLLMLCVTFCTLLLRNNFTKEKKKIISIFIFLYLLELLFPLKEGFEVFYSIFIEKIGISILLGIIFFFSFEYAKQITIKEATKEKILNLAAYYGIERSDMYLLQDILDNKKYKEIAQKIHGSEGALRNKLSRIYKILEVGDRTGFLTIYSGYKLIYEPEALEHKD